MEIKISRWILLAILPIILLTGCLGGSNVSYNRSGSLVVSVSVPDNIAILETGNNAVPNVLEVTISQNGVTLTKEVEITNQNATLSFQNIQGGTWNVHVKVQDNEGYWIYEGKTSATVTTASATTVAVPIYPRAGELEIKYILPPDLDATHARCYITLAGQSSNSDFKTISSSYLVANFMEPPGVWIVGIELYTNNGKVYEEEFAITIRPGRTAQATVTLASGVLDLDLEWNTPPLPPQGLQATVEGNSVTLTWDPNTESNLVGYRVFRSTSADGLLKPIHTKAFNETSFTDEGLEFEKSYWYYIASYNSINQGSRLSAPVVITTNRAELSPPTGMLMRGVAGTGNENTFKRCPNISGFQSVSPGIVEYKLYRGFEPGQAFTFLRKAKNDSGNWSVVDFAVEWGRTHYYYLTAVDKNGEESSPSEIMSFTLKEEVSLSTPIKDTTFERGNTMKVSWECSYDFDEYDILIEMITPNGIIQVYYETVQNVKEIDVFLDESKFIPGNYIVAVGTARTVVSNRDVIISNSHFRPFVIK